MKQFGNPPLSKRTPPFQLTPIFLSNFFMTPLFAQILKTRYPLTLGGRKLCVRSSINDKDGLFKLLEENANALKIMWFSR